MVDLTERIIRVEKQLEEVSKPEVQQRMTSDLNIARENVRKLKDRLDRLIAAEESGGGATAVGTVEIPGTVTLSDPITDSVKKLHFLYLHVHIHFIDTKVKFSKFLSF